MGFERFGGRGVRPALTRSDRAPGRAGFVERVRQLLAPLTAAAVDGTCHVVDEPHRTVLWLKLPSCVLEIEVDWREQAVSALLAKSDGGGRPGGYYMHAGERVRVHLGEALQLIGSTEAAGRLRAVALASGPTAMEAQAAAYADAISQHLDVCSTDVWQQPTPSSSPGK